MKKNLVKVLLTTAMVATIFVGGGNSAKACVEYCGTEDCTDHGYIVAIQTVAERHGYTLDEVFYNDELYNQFEEEIWLTWGIISSHDEFVTMVNECNEWAQGIVEQSDILDTYRELTTIHKNMLAKVNADRTKNGAGKLTWSEELEEIAMQRAVEIMNNAQSKDYADAMFANDYKKQAEVIHSGHVDGLGENAHVAYYTGVSEKKANNAWIESEGHHVVRIDVKYTMYACASYTDSITGMETWVEVFADETSLANLPVFDYMRYATENPDITAIFGQDRDALYNHYITFGAEEGRKAYQTDGTEFGTQTM